MCSNFALTLSREAAREEYGVEIDDPIELSSFYPFRPTKAGTPAKTYSMVPAITRAEDGERVLRRMRWGLLPVWAKSDQDMPQPFNAVGEGIEKKPFFRDAFKARRCLIPATMFFDFNKAKLRHRFEVPGLGHFAFAGLWNRRDDLYTTTFITANPSASFAKYHDRQPVTLVREQFGDWLDPKATAKSLLSMLAAFNGPLKATPEPKKN